MLPRKLHIEQINRFHDKMQDLSDKIKDARSPFDKGNFAMQYFELSELWIKLDNFIEMEVKDVLDSM